MDQETFEAVMTAFRLLPDDSQHLLRLLCTDPPLGDETISEMIRRPIGSIGPTRQRCLEKLRTVIAHDTGGDA